jgi:catechol 2,3-dioxygenase-like lactoylglutathione lyase family enzyme
MADPTRRRVFIDHLTLRVGDLPGNRAFYEAALAPLEGAPVMSGSRLRPRYHAGYYAAYVLDPDGHNIEAVFHGRD